MKDKTNSHAQTLLWQMAVQGIKDALVTAAAATSDRQCSIVLRENSLMSVCQSNGSTLTRALMSTEKKLTRENIFVPIQDWRLKSRHLVTRIASTQLVLQLGVPGKSTCTHINNSCALGAVFYNAEKIHQKFFEFFKLVCHSKIFD